MWFGLPNSAKRWGKRWVPLDSLQGWTVGAVAIVSRSWMPQLMTYSEQPQHSMI
jgi:MFS superfamily sulfate permease-like transporter